MKSIFSSKMVWFNIVMTIIGTGAFIQGLEIANTSILQWSILVQGIGNVILRVWFTSTTLTLSGK